MITAQTPAASATEHRRGRGIRFTVGARLLASLMVAALISLGISSLIPRRLTVSSDIVGYPTYYDYNVTLLPYLYYLGVLVFPTLTLLTYLGLTRLSAHLGRSAAPSRSPATPESDTIPTDRPFPLEWPAAMPRVLLVGAVFGLEAAIIGNVGGPAFWVVTLLTSLAYALVALGAAHRLRPIPQSPALTTLSRLNALAAPLALAGVLGVAGATSVRIAATGVMHHYSWLPWWLMAALTGAALIWVWRASGRAIDEAGMRVIERRALLYLTVPVAILLLVGGVPGDLGPMDVFHEGERLAASTLTSKGWFPWRDLISTHGLLEDSLLPWLGALLVQPSRWGDVAAQTLLLIPCFFLSLYLLAAWAFQRNWPYVASIALAMVGSGLLLPGLPRYLFWPLILVLLGMVLQRRSWWTSALLGALLALQAVLVPELAYGIPACALVVVLFELSHGRRGRPVVEMFARTLWCLAGGLATVLTVAGFLLWQHALGALLFYYLIFAPGHALTGGLPPALHSHVHDPVFDVVVFTPVLALLLAFAYYASAWLARRRLDVLDWVMAAAGIFAMLFYTRFLDRADLGHAFLSYYAALPLIAFLLFRGITWADRSLALAWPRRFWPISRRPASYALLALTVVVVAAPVLSRAQLSASRYRSVAASEPEIARLGYAADGLDPATYHDVQAVLHAYLRPGDWVFDFSNEPGLYYYLLGAAPRTRYFHISMAIPEVAQKDLVAQLQRDPPRLVVFSNDRLGLPEWDGIPNDVRHYDVSQFILDHYRPLLSTHTQLFYALASADLSPAPALSALQETPATDNLYFRSHVCDWGYAPNFLSSFPPAPVHLVKPITLSTAPLTAQATVSGWAGDPATGTAAREVIAVAADREVGAQVPSLDRPDLVDAYGTPGLRNSGFRLVLPKAAGRVRIFGISARGVASELNYGPAARSFAPAADAPRLGQIQLANGTVVPVRPDAVTGYVDTASFASQLRLTTPAGVTGSDYRSLEITTGAALAEDSWWLSDRPDADPDHRIAFKSRTSTGSRYLVRVGSCPQWHGFGPGPLYLTHEGGQNVAAVRLLP